MELLELFLYLTLFPFITYNYNTVELTSSDPLFPLFQDMLWEGEFNKAKGLLDQLIYNSYHMQIIFRELREGKLQILTLPSNNLKLLMEEVKYYFFRRGVITEELLSFLRDQDEEINRIVEEFLKE